MRRLSRHALRLVLTLAASGFGCSQPPIGADDSSAMLDSSVPDSPDAVVTLDGGVDTSVDATCSVDVAPQADPTDIACGALWCPIGMSCCLEYFPIGRDMVCVEGSCLPPDDPGTMCGTLLGCEGRPGQCPAGTFCCWGLGAAMNIAQCRAPGMCPYAFQCRESAACPADAPMCHFDDQGDGLCVR